VIRAAAFIAALLLLLVLLGARFSDAAAADPFRVAWLAQVGASQAAAADHSLAEAEESMRAATDQARKGMSAIVAGNADPTIGLTAAASGFEQSAPSVADAQTNLTALRWTLLALDPDTVAPTLSLEQADVLAISAQWLAAVPPSAALTDLRIQAEGTVTILADALASLDADDFDAALTSLDQAEAALEPVREQSDRIPILGVWIETVDALIAAMRDIALSAQAGDSAALAEAQAAYETAAADAARADQALTIAIGESANQIVRPASTSSADALRAVTATRDELAGLSILR
jgi:hypothetical protein